MVKKFTANKLVSWYLVHSFLYYECNTSIISDQEYDLICSELLKKLNQADHKHKYLIDKEALKAGTAFHLKFNDYPLQVQNIAFKLKYNPKIFEG